MLSIFSSTCWPVNLSYFFGEIAIQFLCPLLIGFFFFFLLLDCIISLHILDMNSAICISTSLMVHTHWKRPWCWERLKAKGEEVNTGWDNWIASLTQWTWTWANSGRQWGTERPGMLQSMGWRRVRHWLNDWTTWCTLKLENHWNKTRWKVESNHSMIWADINWVPRFPRGPCNFHNRLTICWSH